MTIKVYRTVKTVIHRLTLMREYAFIKTDRTIKDSKSFCLIRLMPAKATPENCYIYIGDRAYSRERFDKKECLRKIREKFPLLSEDEVSFLEVSELYRLAEGMILEIDIRGYKMKKKWISDCLQFNREERNGYLGDDFTSVKISFSRIKGRTVRHKDEEPVPVDIADFEVYDRMIDVLYETDKSQAYGDACCIEYSITSDGYEYRYYLTHFFSNHNWNLDPQNILNICFSAELLSGSVSRDYVRFSHPSKLTSRRSDGADYLVEMIKMDNEDVSVKFRSESEGPSEGDVAGARSYDNPVDLTMWIDLFYQEIRMA